MITNLRMELFEALAAEVIYQPGPPPLLRLGSAPSPGLGAEAIHQQQPLHLSLLSLRCWDQQLTPEQSGSHLSPTRGCEDFSDFDLIKTLEKSVDVK